MFDLAIVLNGDIGGAGIVAQLAHFCRPLATLSLPSNFLLFSRHCRFVRMISYFLVLIKLTTKVGYFELIGGLLGLLDVRHRCDVREVVIKRLSADAANTTLL